jgi:hypothetical protein
VAPFAAADAAEVEAQGGHVLRLQGLGHAEDDLEMHDSALERMGMADDGRGLRRAVREHEDRFETPGGASQSKVSLEDTRGLCRDWALCPFSGLDGAGSGCD